MPRVDSLSVCAAVISSSSSLSDALSAPMTREKKPPDFGVSSVSSASEAGMMSS
eukprot:CAMPEP_0184428152 /NCGR_PEP_ID=MMETSP0738-20130409/201664_1 /TAXON_ID=385413 /ORGANISM="Thalassiosira miniscula, Strain CCMP1093" /LENGTH=53 /DNA_ID=CAMNT_0026791967 /DNA_START=44 /DNA_END=202 /DNA_ORIENTATION=+